MKEPPEIWWNPDSEWLMVRFEGDDVIRCMSPWGTSTLFREFEGIFEGFTKLVSPEYAVAK